MAKHGQHPQDTTADDQASNSSGGRQAVVELSEISSCGLVFWSRRRFDIGAEIQVRIKRSALPAASLAKVAPEARWAMLRGLVVASRARRRADGSHGFEISLLLDQTISACAQPPAPPAPMRWFTPPLPGMRRFGLN